MVWWLGRCPVAAITCSQPINMWSFEKKWKNYDQNVDHGEKLRERNRQRRPTFEIGPTSQCKFSGGVSEKAH